MAADIVAKVVVLHEFELLQPWQARLRWGGGGSGGDGQVKVN